MMGSPFRLPGWSARPSDAAELRVFKQGERIDTYLLSSKALLFGRTLPHEPHLGTARLEHQSISREHAAIVNSFNGQVFVVDLNSKYGSLLDGEKLDPHSYVTLNHGAKLRFGASTREYVFCKPGDENENSIVIPNEPEPNKAERSRAAIDDEEQEETEVDPMANYVDEEDGNENGIQGYEHVRRKKKGQKKSKRSHDGDREGRREERKKRRRRQRNDDLQSSKAAESVEGGDKRDVKVQDDIYNQIM